MKNYLSLMKKIIDQGSFKQDRTGTGTYSLFGEQMRFDLSDSFPILTTKKIHFRSVVTELIWFLNGGTNTTYLNKNNCKIWNQWADESGDLGPLYGKQWRRWETPNNEYIDQITNVIKDIQVNPNSRRLVVSAWNPTDLPDETLSPQENVKKGFMALAPCHTLFQFYVLDKKLSCQLYSRSQDFFLGTPFNISSYALLVILIAIETGLEPGELIWVGGDVHLYQNHIEQAKEQLKREPYQLPKLVVKRRLSSLFGYNPDDFELENYECHPAIKAPISI